MPESLNSSLAKDYTEFVPFSARMMAAMRAHESARSDRLFNDPFAAQLAGEEAFHRVEQQLTDQDKAYIAIRTRFFDDFLSTIQVPQVVILASGLDTRPYRLSFQSIVTCYELDFPEVLAYKSSLLKDVQPACLLHSLGTDLTQSWSESLLKAGYCPEKPSLWLAEGLSMYLQEEQVHRLLSLISDLSVSGSYFGLDIINIKSIDYASYKGYFQFGCDFPEQLLSKYGWQAEISEFGDSKTSFGRLNYQVAPREVTDIERVFMIRATRQ